MSIESGFTMVCDNCGKVLYSAFDGFIIRGSVEESKLNSTGDPCGAGYIGPMPVGASSNVPWGLKNCYFERDTKITMLCEKCMKEVLGFGRK